MVQSNAYVDSLTISMQKFRDDFGYTPLRELYKQAIDRYNKSMDRIYHHLLSYPDPDRYRVNFDGSIQSQATGITITRLENENFLLRNFSDDYHMSECISLLIPILRPKHQILFPPSIVANLTLIPPGINNFQVIRADTNLPELFSFNPSMNGFYEEFFNHWLFSTFIPYRIKNFSQGKVKSNFTPLNAMCYSKDFVHISTGISNLYKKNEILEFAAVSTLSVSAMTLLYLMYITKFIHTTHTICSTFAEDP